MAEIWRKCSTCKKPINQGQVYQKCSVSGCRKYAYCSVECWDVHVPIMNHKSAWAEEERAPYEVFNADKTRRRIVASSSKSYSPPSSSNLPEDILIVVSKLKAYVKARSGMNTSGDVAEALSHIVRFSVNDAIDQARAEGRKTVMARDFKDL